MVGGVEEHTVQVLQADTSRLSESEVELIELLMAAVVGKSVPAAAAKKDDEHRSRHWAHGFRSS